MSTGGTEPTSLAVGAFIGPSNMLDFSGCHGFAHMGIVGVWSVRAIHSGLRWMSTEDRGYTLHVWLEAHMIVPLIILHKRFNTTGNGMLVNQDEES